MLQSITLSNESLEAGLYIVATPIGNLKDISLRALSVLNAADVIACEDTRVTRKLMTHYGINTRLESYSDMDGESRRQFFVDMIISGKVVALVSDAGTPLISDPGYKLVKQVRDVGGYVTSLPGASSVVTALTLAMEPTDRFYFGGFFSHKMSGRHEQLKQVQSLQASLVFFERKNRVKDTLVDIHTVLGNRRIAIARELTKKFEEVLTVDLGQSYDISAIDAIKGEVVLVISPPVKDEDSADIENTLAAQLEILLGEMSLKKAVKEMTEQTGLSKGYVYNTALQVKEKLKQSEVGDE